MSKQNIFFNEQTNPDEFQEVQIIGRGGFGCVYELKHIPTGLDLAGKQINDENLGDASKKALESENKIMQAIVSPYAVRYYGKIIFQNKLTVLMDFCDRGSLRDIMNFKNKTLTEPQIAFVMHDLLTALNLLHEQKILHRDVKAANILATSHGEMKLTDFGVSRQFAENAVTFSTISTIGTPYWMAPEVITIGKKYTFPADIWSVGATAVELADGAPPYAEYNPSNAMKEIKTKGFPGFRKGSSHSALFQSFVNKCTVMDPSMRPTAYQLLRDPFVKQVENLDRMKVLEDLIKDKIDFSQLVDDEYEEEEEEEEEAADDDDDDDGMLNTIRFENPTIIATNEKHKNDEEPKDQLQAEKEENSKTKETKEEESHAPENVENLEPTKEENLEPTKIPEETQPEQAPSVVEPKKDKTVVKIPVKKTRTRKYNTKAQGTNKASVQKTLKRFETFIKPSNEEVNDLYAKKTAAKPIQIDESLIKKNEESVSINNSIAQQAPQNQSGSNKIKFYGGIVLLLAILYVTLGTKKFVLILILLLPILFLARNLF